MTELLIASTEPVDERCKRLRLNFENFQERQVQRADIPRVMRYSDPIRTHIPEFDKILSAWALEGFLQGF